MMITAEDKYVSLQKILKSYGNVVLAYSGGVDSSFLLKACIDTLGAENVLACIGISPSLADSQYRQALEFARSIGANLTQIEIGELKDQNYSANNPDRCFHCKSHLYKALARIAAENGYKTIICGSNFDDKDDFRPGNKAAGLYDVHSPLAEARMTKQDIRRISRKLNLPTAEMPASPCLASRFAYGLEITEQRLKQIEQAEDFLRSVGLVEFRVRHHDSIARIEAKIEEMDKIIKEPNRSTVLNKLKSLGFKYITLDIEGFRSGSLNQMLTDSQKQRNN